MHILPALTFIALATAPMGVSAALFSGADLDIDMVTVSSEGTGESIGSVRIQKHEDGVLFTPDLKGLEPGLHGFHLHGKASCEPAMKDGKKTAAASAGGHFNPDNGEHRGPYEKEHAGDLPALYVNEAGEARMPVLAPNLEFNDLANRALMIHSGGDNYSDEPEPLGGGASRVACGVIAGDLPSTDDLSSTTATKDAGIKPKVININHATLSEDNGTVGTIRIEEKAKGVVLTPNLEGLKPGLHGFHVHENGDCSSTRENQDSDGAPQEVAAGAAGGHLNPGLTGGHTGPYGEGHLGDLPNLYVDENGVADHPVYAPRLRLRDFSDRALMIHASADNYSDDPDENGGSGSRIACGVVD